MKERPKAFPMASKYAEPGTDWQRGHFLWQKHANWWNVVYRALSIYCKYGKGGWEFAINWYPESVRQQSAALKEAFDKLHKEQTDARNKQG